MADTDVHVNGVNDNGNGGTTEFVDADAPPKKTPTADSDDGLLDRLNRKIAALEQEENRLERKNDESANEIGELKGEVAVLKKEKEAEVEKSESAGRAAEAIAKRAAELEGEVARLQRDLITAMNEGEEANREVMELKAKIGELEKKVKAADEEIEALRREKKDATESVGKLQALLEESSEKVKIVESKMEDLMKKSAESELLIGGMMEKIAVKEREAIPETDANENSSSSGLKGLKTQLPLIGAVSAGAVVATMAICYIRHSKIN